MKLPQLIVCATQLVPAYAIVLAQLEDKEATLTVTGMEITRTNVVYVPLATANGGLKPDTTGTLMTSLETEGHPHLLPFPTPALPSIKLKIPGASHNQSLVDPIVELVPRGIATDCFTGPSNINQTGSVSTHKFYANFFLGKQDQGVWTHPYSLTWRDRATGTSGYPGLVNWGMGISHVEPYLRGYGPVHSNLPGSPVEFYVNPIGIRSIILSASEFNTTTVLSTEKITAFSVNAVLSPQAGSSSRITFPCVQGMAFVTAIYQKLTPLIQSTVFFRNIELKTPPVTDTFKYRVTLEDGRVWLLYAFPSNGNSPNLTKLSPTQLQGAPNWSGYIQVAKISNATDEAIYDSSAGVYPDGVTLKGSVSGSSGTYQLNWNKGGLMNRTLLNFALPHHVQSFDGQTKGLTTTVQLQTTTKGMATAVMADNWTLAEPALPIGMSFDPWSPSTGSKSNLSTFAINVTTQVAQAELAQDIVQISNLNSMYYSGKALSKYAMMVYTAKYLLLNSSMASTGLDKLKIAFKRFSSNQQQIPLVYDSKWGGVVSSAWDPNADFGNSYYNDHHFHYGYFIHAAAVIGLLDPPWLSNGTNAAWVNTLVRDARSASVDSQFPFSRAFDWYHGHSWAKGLFEAPDGKDEESSSEDTFFAYALKMWGKVSGDTSLEARGNLMLAVLARSLDNYFLMTSSNTNQPANFISNKAAGITFENKVDHKTYFGDAIEYIEGIHMLPLAPSSAYTRSQTFIREEWNAFFSTNSSVKPASSVAGGWRGILYGNLACIDPKSAWKFFAQESFDPGWIDGGASRTWYLAFSAAIGGI